MTETPPPEDVTAPAPPADLASAKRRRLTGAARRVSFLNAAAEIVLEKGAYAVTMDGVAARSNVSKRLAYRYFGNREDLIQALIEREMEEITRRQDLILPPNPPLEQRIRVGVHIWLCLVQERGPLLSRLRATLQAQEELGLEKFTVHWAAILTADGRIAPQTAMILAQFFLASLRGACDSLEQKIAPLDRIAEVCAVAILAGISANADKARDG